MPSCWDDTKDIDKVNMQRRRLESSNVSENRINQLESDEQYRMIGKKRRLKGRNRRLVIVASAMYGKAGVKRGNT